MLRRLRRLFGSDRVPVLDSLEAYAHWAASYPPHAHNALMQAEEAAMRSLLPDLRDQRVLDLACGTGRYGLLARENGAAQVLGLDNSPDMLASSALRSVALATAEALPLPTQSMDVVLCGLALGHLPDIGPALREIGRILTPGGWALLSDLHPQIALNGGQRTFVTGDGRTYAVEHYPHLVADYQRAAHVAGLQVVHVLERPVEGAPSRVPAVLVIALRR
ncbi:MAG: class I SAM-dependent methyltransferase [Anaerolineae bacterium]|nr:class I SAM-dependent methyltransferase [Anaerolineae bacterium]